MEALLEALQTKTWRLKQRKKVYDEPCNTEVAWHGGSNSDVFDMALASAPVKHYTFAQLNRSVEMKRHVDGRNFEGSLILLLGEFTGGALCFDDGRRITQTGVWHRFDGHLPHWVEPFEGERFSVILFNNPSLVRRIHLVSCINERRAQRRAALHKTEAISNETP